MTKFWWLCICALVSYIAIFEDVENQTVDEFFKLKTDFGKVNENFIRTCLNVVHYFTFYFRLRVLVIDDI